jgi:hypothetical protein
VFFPSTAYRKFDFLFRKTSRRGLSSSSSCPIVRDFPERRAAHLCVSARPSIFRIPNRRVREGGRNQKHRTDRVGEPVREGAADFRDARRSSHANSQMRDAPTGIPPHHPQTLRKPVASWFPRSSAATLTSLFPLGRTMPGHYRSAAPRVADEVFVGTGSRLPPAYFPSEVLDRDDVSWADERGT